MADYQPPWLQTLPHQQRPAFRAYRQFNSLRDQLHFGPDKHGTTVQSICSVKSRLNHDKLTYFSTDRMPDKVARILGEAEALDTKEVIESFEFFQRVRHRISRSVVVDLCCGHGLVGMLFALLERKVEHVFLLDVEFPKSSYIIESLLNKVWPWVSPKLHRVQRSVKGAHGDLPQGAGIVAVHACGARTDWSIDVARQLKGPLAVMPCCYAHQVYQGPETLKRHLGVTLCVDIQRTMQLETAHYSVDWQEIPPEITPKNRIISASPTHVTISHSRDV
jgi:hypothetical protein